MKKVKTIFSFLMLTLVLFLITACKKDLTVNISWGQNEIKLTVGESVNVKPNVTYGKNIKDKQKKLTYEVADTTIATVTNEGMLTAQMVGSTTLKVTASDKAKTSKSINIVVSDQTYTITYDLVDGTLPADAKTTYQVSDLPLSLPIPTKDGFEFLGWLFEGELLDTITEVGNYELKASWQLETNKVIYHYENGHFEKKPLDSWDLAVEEFMHDFYNFLGLSSSYDAFKKGSDGTYQSGLWHTNYYSESGKNRLFHLVNGIITVEENSQYFLNSEEYHDKWIAFFDKINEYVKIINSSQSLYNDGNAGPIRLYQLFDQYAANWLGSNSLLSKHAGRTIDPLEELRKLLIVEITPPIEYDDTNVVAFPDVVNNYGLDFLGWYTTSDFKEGTKITNSQGHTGHLHVYARWEDETKASSVVVKNEIQELELYKTHQFEWEILPLDTTIQVVEFTSDNPNVLSVTKDGKLQAKKLGTAKITMKFIGDAKFNKVYEIEVVMPDNIDISFDASYTGALNVNDTIQIITTLSGKYKNQSVTYTSDNTTIATVSDTGVVTAVSEGFVTIKVALTDDPTKNITIGVCVKGKKAEDRVDEVIDILVKANQARVDTFTAELISGNPDIAIVYGSVNLYLFAPLTMDERARVAPHGAAIPKVEFITVHDTASPAGRINNATYLSNVNNNSASTSIHYVVGDKGVTKVEDESLMAYHAGDGTTVPFEWINTGVKQSDKSKPKFGVIDGYFSVNGTKTNIKVPVTGKRSNGTEATITNVSEKYFTTLGPVWKIGDDNTVYMGNTWACFTQVYEGAVSSRGGNTSSIGIETCVNTSGDLYDTWQRTAKLCADILTRYDLDVSRVQQHNTFSGKDCPHAMRKVGYWDRFIEMISVEKAIRENYRDAKITMVSNNPSIVDNTGRVISRPNNTTSVSYTITVEINGVKKTVTLSSVIPGLCTWYN